MPEGPEVRVFADELALALTGKKLITVSARTKRAREWLEKNPNLLPGKTVIDVFAYGKNLIGLIEGNLYFYSHQMMWGRWIIVEGETPPQVDRRERARLVVADKTAVLMSAPVFELGSGDPFESVEYLKDLGPNALLYPGETFDTGEFRKRFSLVQNLERTIGSVLLDQTVVAGLGNYLRAEIMFEARLDPWRTVGSLNTEELDTVSHLVPAITLRAFESKATVADEHRKRMREDSTLVYVPGKDYGTRHYVFRRTNLPCLICGTPIKQMRQETGPILLEDAEDDEEQKTRIVYFCVNCQHVKIPAKLKPVKRPKIVDTESLPIASKAGEVVSKAAKLKSKRSQVSGANSNTDKVKSINTKSEIKASTTKVIISSAGTTRKPAAKKEVVEVKMKPKATVKKTITKKPAPVKSTVKKAAPPSPKAEASSGSVKKKTLVAAKVRRQK